MQTSVFAPSEHQIRNGIIDLLRYEGYLCWTNNSGAMKNSYTDKNGITRNRFTRFGGILGASDIFALTPKTGRFVAIEIKTPRRKNNTTPAQADFISLVNHHGGLAFVAWSTEMVAQKLGIKTLF